jgi:iron complex outermembrane recepter protein
MAIHGALVAREILVFSAVISSIVLSSSACASSQAPLNIPSGRLDVAILRLGAQAGISIALSDPSLGSIRVHGVRGSMDAASALRIMLKNTGIGFAMIDARTFRVSKLPPPRKPATVQPRKVIPAPSLPAPPPRRVNVVTNDPPPPSPEIIVTGSKRETSLADFPGSVSILSLDVRLGGFPGQHGTGEIVNRLPDLSSTSLGPGRNKLFIRGVADSSFNGPTQATVGQYFGDARISYNAPDPDLSLYDIKSVEVLEGPQGTLYGAGSLGGIIRLIPNAPDLNDNAATIALGGAVTAQGVPSYDASAMLNLSILNDRIALRVVGYRLQDGGYIDDTKRGLRDINRTVTNGGRAMLRINPGDNWTIDLNTIRQDIYSRDGQYSERGQPELARASNLAQPFDNDYRLGELAIRKKWDTLSLVSSTVGVSHLLGTNFDATPKGSSTPILFSQQNDIVMFSHETRLARKQKNGKGWLLGLSALYDDETLTRTLGPPTAEKLLTGVENQFLDLAVFGEWTFGIAPRLDVSIGGRLAYDIVASQLLELAGTDEFSVKETATPFLPHIALSWKPSDNLLIFARYHEGFRAGGLSIASTGSREAVQEFASDTIDTYELGLRYGDQARDRFSVTVTVSRSRWENIQADLVDSLGFPYSANVGNGSIFGVSASAQWRPALGFNLQASAFVNNGGLVTQFVPAFSVSPEIDFPNIADFGGRLAVSYNTNITADMGLSINASARYVGKSTLGVGTMLDIPQGKYMDTAFDMRVAYKNYGFVLGVTNLFNERGNRFSFGNPFRVTDRLQETPLRPRTIRIGLDAAF